jgi:hypothetical protein
MNGHTNVPTKSGPLGAWMCKQRKQYRFLQKRKESQLTIEKRRKLEGIGFEFKRNKRDNEKSIIFKFHWHHFLEIWGGSWHLCYAWVNYIM